MTALPCPVSRDEYRHSAESGRQWAREIAIERRTMEIANELDAVITRKYGFSAWSDALQVLAQEVAEAEINQWQSTNGLTSKSKWLSTIAAMRT